MKIFDFRLLQTEWTLQLQKTFTYEPEPCSCVVSRKEFSTNDIEEPEKQRLAREDKLSQQLPVLCVIFRFFTCF